MENRSRNGLVPLKRGAVMNGNEIRETIDSEFLKSVSDVLTRARKSAQTAVNLSMVYAYFEIGRMIVEEEQHGENRASYGAYRLQTLSDYLLTQFGKGFSVTNLKQMRQFYLIYGDDQISQTLSDQFKNLPTVSTGRKFWGLKEFPEYSESELESRIIDHLQQFLLELGTGFAFVGRQERFTFDEEHFMVDLVFYNRLLRCFVLFDLKIGELKHQDIGQMQMYVNYYDRKVKLADENKTIGIILCRDKNNAVVEMTLPEDGSQIFASKYETVLPKKEDLRRLLEEQIVPSDEGEDN